MNFSTLDSFDFTSLTTSVTFSGASLLRCVDIIIIDDQVIEGTEDFNVTLATGDAALKLTTTSARVIIRDMSGSYTVIPQKFKIMNN